MWHCMGLQTQVCNGRAAHKHTGMPLYRCAHDACQLPALLQVKDWFKANVQQQRVCLRLLSCGRMSNEPQHAVEAMHSTREDACRPVGVTR